MSFRNIINGNASSRDEYGKTWKFGPTAASHHPRTDTLIVCASTHSNNITIHIDRFYGLARAVGSRLLKSHTMRRSSNKANR
ncbi:hypothetical protein Y032_0324g2538 [Ancylostoma ceylanicum]|nr:hypothetical protein Y032_0324g2538 [Ancylostoma ceylanicum]